MCLSKMNVPCIAVCTRPSRLLLDLKYSSNDGWSGTRRQPFAVHKSSRLLAGHLGDTLVAKIVRADSVAFWLFPESSSSSLNVAVVCERLVLLPWRVVNVSSCEEWDDEDANDGSCPLNYAKTRRMEPSRDLVDVVSKPKVALRHRRRQAWQT